MNKKLFVLPICLMLLAACNSKSGSSSSMSSEESSSDITSSESTSVESSESFSSEPYEESSSSSVSSEESSAVESSSESSEEVSSEESSQESSEQSSSEESTSKPLPVIENGPADRTTRVEGAGAWIYLDNTELGINGANAGDIIEASSFKLTVTKTDETSDPGADNFITGGPNAITMLLQRFDDYDDPNHIVRLFIEMNIGVDTSWKLKHEFEISVVIDGISYESTETFIGGAHVVA